MLHCLGDGSICSRGEMAVHVPALSRTVNSCDIKVSIKYSNICRLTLPPPFPCPTRKRGGKPDFMASRLSPTADCPDWARCSGCDMMMIDGTIDRWANSIATLWSVDEVSLHFEVNLLCIFHFKSILQLLPLCFPLDSTKCNKCNKDSEPS
jgi:hypothetical protein